MRMLCFKFDWNCTWFSQENVYRDKWTDIQRQIDIKQKTGGQKSSGEVKTLKN